jgi:hypothetical protein
MDFIAPSLNVNKPSRMSRRIRASTQAVNW